MREITVTKYVADDGVQFNDYDECLKYEITCDKVNFIMGGLQSKSFNINFANGHGFIQQTKLQVVAAMGSLLFVVKSYIPDHKSVDLAIEQSLAGEFVSPHTTIVSRLIDEMCPRVVQDAWHRFACMDVDFREWGQPYFALHPDIGEHIQLND